MCRKCVGRVWRQWKEKLVDKCVFHWVFRPTVCVHIYLSIIYQCIYLDPILVLHIVRNR